MTAGALSPHRPLRRRPTWKGSGLAQQTLVEHALCPLDVTQALERGSLHSVRYPFTDRNRNRKTATATVAAPFGLSPHDELYLYGLLALTFAQPEPSVEFSATPHWCLRQLGIVEPEQEQGKRYQAFREAIRRLSGVVYQNDRFYDPIRGEHRDVAFGFLKYSLPAEESSSRAWHFVWDQQWFSFCLATAGSFTFDFTMYRSLDCASRRLFLLLSKIFWRSDVSPAFEIRQLGIQSLGFSETVATNDIKQKLIRTAEVLLSYEIIALPPGVSSVRELFTKQAKGVHVVRFHKGAYYDRVQDQRFTFSAEESPLVEPLQRIGFDSKTIHRILNAYPPRMVAEWSDITLAAVERKIIRESPQAFFQHYIREAAAKKTTPPDWWRALRKQEREREREAVLQTGQQNVDAAFERYLQEEARDAFHSVMDKLFRQLRDSGQMELDARTNAEQFARMHLRNQFWQAHPEYRSDQPQRRLPLPEINGIAGCLPVAGHTRTWRRVFWVSYPHLASHFRGRHPHPASHFLTGSMRWICNSAKKSQLNRKTPVAAAPTPKKLVQR